MAQLKVVITDLDLSSIDIERSILEPLGATIERHACKTEQDVIDVGADADVLLVQWAPITQHVIDHLERCRLIGRYGIGVDMIDLSAATAAGIAVYNVPDYALEEVANHTVSLLLALNQQLLYAVQNLQAGRWNTGVFRQPIYRLSEKTLGLLSYGRIARLVGKRMAAFGMRVITHDPYVQADAIAGTGVEWVDMETLVRESDFLSLHAPLTSATKHIIDQSVLERMKATAAIINTARGGLIDTDALVSALQRGVIAGAALDVFEQEPLPVSHPLYALDNAILTPHIAWYSTAALPTIQNNIAQEVVRFVSDQPLNGLLNPAWSGSVGIDMKKE
jgi:D-3-phosphoglycerate dehydrogenase / 2-oxoglutarate reductase